MIARLNETDGMTILMISHDVQAALRYASHILYLASRCSSGHGTTLSGPLPAAGIWTCEEAAMTLLIEKLVQYWAYPFVRYALIVGIPVPCAPLFWG